jgi:hypothetical protein
MIRSCHTVHLDHNQRTTMTITNSSIVTALRVKPLEALVSFARTIQHAYTDLHTHLPHPPITTPSFPPLLSENILHLIIDSRLRALRPLAKSASLAIRVGYTVPSHSHCAHAATGPSTHSITLYHGVLIPFQSIPIRFRAPIIQSHPMSVPSVFNTPSTFAFLPTQPLQPQIATQDRLGFGASNKR